MIKINKKSDFDIILVLYDKWGRMIGFPTIEFTARLFTSLPQNAVVATNKGGVLVNCYDDGDRLHIVADGKRLPEGELRCELTLEIPDGSYPDLRHRLVETQALGVEIVSSGGNYDGLVVTASMSLSTDMSQWAAVKRKKRSTPGPARFVFFEKNLITLPKPNETIDKTPKNVLFVLKKMYFSFFRL